jgi:hypothetical protein
MTQQVELPDVILLRNWTTEHAKELGVDVSRTTLKNWRRLMNEKHSEFQWLVNCFAKAGNNIYFKPFIFKKKFMSKHDC